MITTNKNSKRKLSWIHLTGEPPNKFRIIIDDLKQTSVNTVPIYTEKYKSKNDFYSRYLRLIIQKLESQLSDEITNQCRF